MANKKIRPEDVTPEMVKAVLTKIGAQGSKGMTKGQLKKRAKKAAKARWKNHKKAAKR